MTNILSIILLARQNHIYLWQGSNSSELSVSYDKQHGLPDDIKELITNNKQNILDLLSKNSIDSKEKAKKVVYYKNTFETNEGLLSDFQKGIYLQTKLDREANTYNVFNVIKLTGDLNPDFMKQALRLLLIKHRILRLNVKDDFKYQLRDINDMQVKYLKLKQSEINDYIKQQIDCVFDLESGQLIKLELVKCIEDDSYLVNLTHHHILTDAYSKDLLVHDVFKIYNDLINNYINQEQLVRDATKQLGYLDFISHQNAMVNMKDYKLAQTELMHQLSNCSKIQLTAKHVSQFNNKGSSFEIDLGSDLYKGLVNLSHSYSVSLYAILVTCFYYVLSVYDQNKEQFAIATTVSNRTDEFANAIGPFINTVPIIFDFDHQHSILENIKHCQERLIYLNQYSLLNLTHLTDDNQCNTTLLLDLIHVMFTMHNFVKQQKRQLNEIKYEEIKIKENTEKFGLSVTVVESLDDIKLHVSYAISVYEGNYIKQILHSYIQLISQVATKDLACTNFKSNYLLSNDEYQTIIYKWNQTKSSYPEKKTIHQLFEEQVNRTPDNIAIVYEETRLTYKELNQRSNQLAHYLRDTYEVKGDDLIALCLDRNEYMLIAILGVLKAGGAYVPMDPGYPDARIQYILGDTNTKVVIANEKYKDKLTNIIKDIVIASRSAQVIASKADTVIVRYTKQSKPKKTANKCNICLIDEEPFQQKQQSQLTTNPEINITSKNLAYVIYTSGTTGIPKGVMLEHRQMTTFIVGFINKFMDENTRSANMLSTTNYVFDIFGLEYLLPLLQGFLVELLNNNKLLEQTANIMVSKYRFIQLTPSKLPLIISQLKNDKVDKRCVVDLLLGGEPLANAELRLIQNYKTNNPNIEFEIINLYGPTETTVWSTMSVILGNKVNIGKPLYNETSYILDGNLAPLPIGALGELYIGGAGLARGYLNQPSLTAEKFISNPFQTASEKSEGNNSRLYKTGDLVRYLSDGNIEYLGRNDFQVKIRGFRIELGEIESRLTTYPDIKQAVALARDSMNSRLRGNDISNNYLVGYYVSDTKLNQEEVLNYLKEYLPDYMIPSILVHLEKLPLTVNGKLDRKALPDPEFTKQQPQYIEPETVEEKSICQMVAGVLNLSQEKVGLQDNFFRLGGNSLLAVRLINAINNHFKSNLRVTDIFTSGTIADLLKLHLCKIISK